ncbi:type I-F CRISPR-associated endoribonuclease Cas6/Csy4 [Catenovulum sediminis]|uniref:Type I-F CRISPR-associated endoribonuclease Cas6/Csy4 n=1 Tax=Catenovulum sediminis TaxID=1740262 RepID=A0ABV1RJN6_9ALTE
MQFYCEIKVLPDPEASEPVLVNNLMSKFHRTLVNLKMTDIGVSFPNYAKTLGDTVRFHSSEQSLNKLLETNWLKGLRDYCEVSAILPIPSKVQYRTVSRVQSKSVYNKRKRSVAKGWLTEREAEIKIDDSQQKTLKLPFLQLNSSSTQQDNIKLFVKHGELQTKSSTGTFNSYGLSKSATVPWF